MRKKLGIIVTVVLVLTMLLTTLIACSEDVVNKEVSGKDDIVLAGSISAGDILGDLFNSWLAESGYDANNNANGDMGWDMNFGFSEGANSDLAINFKGAITNNNNNDAFEIGIVDNKKQGDAKNIVGIVVNHEALYLTLAGEHYKMKEIGIDAFSSSLATGTADSINKVLDFVSMGLSALGMFTDSGSEFSATKQADGKYTMDYEARIDIWGGLGGILGMLEDFIPAGTVDTISSIIQGTFQDTIIVVTGALKDMELKETITETDSAIKYSYTFTGGVIVADNTVITVDSRDGKDYNIALEGVDLSEALPEINPPSSNVRDINILKHQFTGEFNVKVPDAIGGDSTLATFTYNVNIELNEKNFIKSIGESIKAKSTTPLLRSIFEKGSTGKLLIDVMHTCGATCIDHMRDATDGVILTVAYDPDTVKGFGNGKIYIAADLQTIIPNLKDLVGEENIKYIKPLLPADYVSFIIDPMVFGEIEDAKNLNKTPKRSSRTQSVSSTTETKTPTIDVVSILINLIGSFTTSSTANGGALEVNIDNILNNVVKKLNVDDATMKTINQILDLLFPGANKLSFSVNDYVNGEDADFNKELDVKSEFLEKTPGVRKSFAVSGGTPVPIGAKDPVIAEGSKELNGINPKISTSAVTLYDAEGKNTHVSYSEIMNLVLDGKSGTSSTVRINYTDIDGTAQVASVPITGIVGLNPSIIGTPQTFKLILSKTNGDSFYPWLTNLTELMGGDFVRPIIEGLIKTDLTPIIELINGIVLPEMMVDYTVTLSALESEKWSQDGIGADDKHFDANKTYKAGDSIVTKFKYTYTYTDKTLAPKVYDAEPNNLEYNFSGEAAGTLDRKIIMYKSFNVNYSVLGGNIRQTLPLKFDTSSAHDKKEITMYTNENMNFNVSYFQNSKTNSPNRFVKESFQGNFANSMKDIEGAACKENRDFTDIFIKSIDMYFTKAGTYKLIIYDAGTRSAIFNSPVAPADGSSIEYTINVYDNNVEEISYAGMNDPADGSIKKVLNNENNAIGLTKQDVYRSGKTGSVDKILEGFAVTKGANFDEAATEGVDYTLDGLGYIKFLTVNKYRVSYTGNTTPQGNPKTFSVHFDNKSEALKVVIEGANTVETAKEAYITESNAIGLIKVEKNELGTEVSRAAYVDGFTITKDGTAAILTTDYTLDTSGNITFVTTGTFVVTITEAETQYSVHFTVNNNVDEIAYEGMNDGGVDSIKKVLNGANNAIGLTWHNVYWNGTTSEKTTIKEGFVVTKGVAFDEVATEGVDYDLDGLGNIKFLTVNKYRVSYTGNTTPAGNAKPFSVHFNNLTAEMTVTIEGTNQAETAKDAYITESNAIGLIKVEVNALGTEVSRAAYVDGFTITKDGTAAILTTDYTLDTSGNITFVTTGTFVVTITEAETQYSVHFTVNNNVDEIAYEGMNDGGVDSIKKVLNGANNAIGLTWHNVYWNGTTSEKTTIKEGFVVTKGVAFDEVATEGVDYELDGLGKIMFLTLNTYRVSYTGNTTPAGTPKPFSVHFNNLTTDLTVTIEGVNTAETATTAYTDEAAVIGLIKVEVNAIGEVLKVVYVDGFAITKDGVAATVTTDYTIDDKGNITFITAGAFVVTITEGLADYSAHFTSVLNVYTESITFPENVTAYSFFTTPGTVITIQKISTSLSKKVTIIETVTGAKNFKIVKTDGSTYTNWKLTDGNRIKFKNKGSYILTSTKAGYEEVSIAVNVVT